MRYFLMRRRTNSQRAANESSSKHQILWWNHHARADSFATKRSQHICRQIKNIMMISWQAVHRCLRNIHNVIQLQPGCLADSKMQLCRQNFSNKITWAHDDCTTRGRARPTSSSVPGTNRRDTILKSTSIARYKGGENGCFYENVLYAMGPPAVPTPFAVQPACL